MQLYIYIYQAWLENPDIPCQSQQASYRDHTHAWISQGFKGYAQIHTAKYMYQYALNNVNTQQREKSDGKVFDRECSIAKRV